MTELPQSEATLTVAQRRWLEHIKRQRRSGLSMATYARQQGLAISTFYAMRKRLSTLAIPETKAPRPLFQAVTLIQAQTPESSMLTLSFDLPGELCCSVQADVATGAALLQRLAQTLA